MKNKKVTAQATGRVVGILVLIIIIAVTVFSSYLFLSYRPTSQMVTSSMSLGNVTPSMVRFQGTILPFLNSSTLLGPANLSNFTVLGFYLKSSNASEINLLYSWEEYSGIYPGNIECPTLFVTTRSGNSSTTSANYIESSSSIECARNPSKLTVTFAKLESWMSISINVYSYHGEVFYANPQDPLIPGNIAAILLDIEGLNNYSATTTV